MNSSEGAQSTCTIPVLLVRYKNGSWHMCVDIRVINHIITNYKFSNPCPDDMLDMLKWSKLFLKIHL